MTKSESSCYGISEADIRKEYMESFVAKRVGLEMVVMSLLSDAQELQSFGHAQALDQSRKNMNIAKFILTQMMTSKEIA